MENGYTEGGYILKPPEFRNTNSAMQRSLGIKI